MGDICLLAEDLLDPFNDYLLEFHQEDQKEGPISIHADMLTAQSLTIPLPKDLKPGPVHIKIYPYRFGSITFKSSTVESQPAIRGPKPIGPEFAVRGSLLQSKSFFVDFWNQ